MRYHLYVDLASSRARVHREDCAHTMRGGTSNRKDGYWVRFLSREEAFSKLEEARIREGIRDRQGCGHCKP